MSKLEVSESDPKREEVFKSCIVEKIEVGLSGAVHPMFLRNSKIDIEKMLDGEIIYRFRTYLAGRRHEKEWVGSTMNVPKSWWEHTKKRFAPKWFIKKYPVQYNIVEIKRVYFITNICPHIDLPATNAQHLYMLLDDGVEE